MTLSTLLALLLAATLAACGGNDATGPTTTPTSINVTLSAGELVAGTTARATASLLRSGGTSSAVTTGWLSDNPTVATVTNDGTVTALNNGRATIYVVSEGRQGQAIVRVYPAYAGTWSGDKVYRRCVEVTGEWSGSTCPTSSPGAAFSVDLRISQTLGSVTGVPELFAGDAYPPTTASIDGAGGFELVSSWVAPDGVHITATLRVLSATADQLTGTLLQERSVPGFEGHMVEELELFMTRTAGPLASRSPRGRGVKEPAPQEMP